MSANAPISRTPFCCACAAVETAARAVQTTVNRRIIPPPEDQLRGAAFQNGTRVAHWAPIYRSPSPSNYLSWCMSPSQLLVFRLVTAAGLVAAADPGTELQVLRVSPGTDAAPTAAVTLTFDRPVAGSLDRSVDPEGIFRIEPAVRGRLDWRDPVTLRFRPDAPLPANASYTITVSDRFEAMDGSRLRVPYVHRFRVRGPWILASQPISQ